MRFLYGYDVATDLAPQTAYHEVAQALGAAGEAVTKPEDVGAALDRAFASGVPYLVNVMTDPGRHTHGPPPVSDRSRCSTLIPMVSRTSPR